MEKGFRCQCLTTSDSFVVAGSVTYFSKLLLPCSFGFWYCPTGFKHYILWMRGDALTKLPNPSDLPTWFILYIIWFFEGINDAERPFHNVFDRDIQSLMKYSFQRKKKINPELVLLKITNYRTLKYLGDRANNLAEYSWPRRGVRLYLTQCLKRSSPVGIFECTSWLNFCISICSNEKPCDWGCET